MTFPRARLVVSACLFVGWLGFLLYLVVQNQHMIVLSRPQFLVAPNCVVAEVAGSEDHPAPKVTIDRVVWGEVADKQVEVPALAKLGAKEGYRGPGRYILPLAAGQVEGRTVCQLVPVPAYPTAELRIYAVTRETESQLVEIERLRR
jgi:hypothetical protein